MVHVTMSLAGASTRPLVNGSSHDPASSTGAAGYATSPESSPSSGKRSSSLASGPLYMTNGTDPGTVKTPSSENARRGSLLPQPSPPKRQLSGDNLVLASRTNGIQAPAGSGNTNLTRAKTELDLKRVGVNHGQEQENWTVRHGWDDQYNSNVILEVLSKSYFSYFTDKRHDTDGRPKLASPRPPPNWSVKDRTKTASAALVVCLNLGVDPPDVIKPNPSANLECWTTTQNNTMTNSKILENIGKKLQEQFESLSLKTKYKQYLDPSIEETRKFCTNLRRNAREERVLFYYNGHGVPLPTPSGEIWVFNRDFTQYIPIALYDLQTWLGGPTLCIYDCSHAGSVVANYERNIQKHEEENKKLKDKDPHHPVQNYGDNVHLAACGKTEQLPTNPELPADLFTSCLTTPIDISLLFHVLQNPIHHSIELKDLRRVPGKASERRSPMGELNWIFTAITDTIAWNALSQTLFRKLFRQDLMVAALFRNYLLAERIMIAYGCHPTTFPEIPATHNHQLWDAWDLAVEMVVSQLPALLGPEPYEYQQSNFFTEQLRAFEQYLEQGAPNQEQPTQLPIVLQVLLSQAHRLKALILLSRFVDLGPWAVGLALTIGIFPYVVKLLQSPAVELKPIMIFIWARIMAVAPQDTHNELLRDNNFNYFVNVLQPGLNFPVDKVNALEHKAMSAFVLTMFCQDFPQAQHVCLQAHLMDHCLEYLHPFDEEIDNVLLRQWACLAISMLWKDFTEAKWVAIRCLAHHQLCSLALDPIPDVRAAAIHAHTNFLGIPDLTEQVAQNEELVASALMVMATDANVMVRRELLVFYSVFIKRYQNKFVVAAYETLVAELDNLRESNNVNENERLQRVNGSFTSGSSNDSQQLISEDSVQGAMWFQLITLSVDPHPDVAQTAASLVDYVHNALLESPLAAQTQQTLDFILDLSSTKVRPGSRAPSQNPQNRNAASPAPNTNEASQRAEGYLSMGIRRTASVAAALKYFVGGNASTEDLSNGKQSPASPQSKKPGSKAAASQWTSPTNQHDTTKAFTPKNIPGKTPQPRNFTKRLDRGIITLPLASDFLSYSTEYFLEPQMRSKEAEEPGSDDYNQRLWRRERNDRILGFTQPLKSVAGSSKWDADIAFFNNTSQPSKMSFHQFEDHLVIADDKDGLSIWNWRDQARLSRFTNGNPAGSKINEAGFVNEDDQAMLITGSSDGVVRLFRHYDRPKHVELVSAWRALSEMVPSTKNAGLVFDWQQSQGRLLVAGDAKVIRVWNANTELCTRDIPARSGSCITSLTSDQVVGDVFAAGYGDGAVRVFDQRLKPALAQVKVWREQRQWIVGVHLQRGGMRELISGARNGDVRLWDVRMDRSLSAVRTLPLSSPSEGGGGGASKGVMRMMSVHEHAPVFAT